MPCHIQTPCVSLKGHNQPKVFKGISAFNGDSLTLIGFQDGRIRNLYSFISDQTGKMLERAVVSSFRIIRKTAGRKFTGFQMVA
jgi:hypothetical protein